MSLSIGIVGLPNVGKSTLFNALTKKAVPAENYPFCTIDPSVGVVAVPDERLEKLNTFSKSKKKIPAAVEFVDIAGLVKGASEGEGLGNQFLSHIRETNAIAHIVRVFEDSNIIHVHGGVDPVSDIGVINLELVLADAETVSKRLGNVSREAKRGVKTAIAEESVLKKIDACLSQGKLVSELELTDEEMEIAKLLNLITIKPMLYVLNKKAGAKNIIDDANDPRTIALMKYLKTRAHVLVDAGIESELKDMEGEEKEMFRKELSADNDDGINALIHAGYKLLGLITYFTTGEDETRAWTIKENSTAPVAGMAIHTDFREKFIKAEIIHWDELLASGSYGVAREKGLLRTEGKEYIVKDGDVVEFKI